MTVNLIINARFGGRIVVQRGDNRVTYAQRYEGGSNLFILMGDYSLDTGSLDPDWLRIFLNQSIGNMTEFDMGRILYFPLWPETTGEPRRLTVVSTIEDTNQICWDTICRPIDVFIMPSVPPGFQPRDRQLGIITRRN